MASVVVLEGAVEADDELALIEKARNGERAAAEALLVRHELLAYRTCRHLLPADEDVESAVQETLFRALRGLRSYAGRGSFAGWVTTIAVNLCRDRLRRRRLVPFVPLETGESDDEPGPVTALPAPAVDPERAAMARQAFARVSTEIRRLPQRQREAFALRFFVGLELEAIAEALGVDVGTVKTHLHRAIHRVRRVAEEAMP